MNKKKIFHDIKEGDKYCFVKIQKKFNLTDYQMRLSIAKGVIIGIILL